MDEKSFGDRDTLRSGTGEGEKSFGDRETLRDGWGILEEWGGKRWKAGEEILGRYVVERELGQGGMGVVYGCFDKVGGVRVAVKALPPELSHNSVEMEEVRENFELVVELRHPNIAGARTLERDGRGEYFLVMDVAEGVSLRKWLREKWKAGGVSLKEATDVLRQVAAALDYAHGERVVHRDVKPGNVMIDGRGRVKVLDFGLAAQIRTSLSRASQAYRGTSGTGPYMAPEQWLGKPQDGKADQYALAVMAYEMLAGRLPFENSELAVLKDAVLHGVADPIPGLPSRALGALRRAMAKRKEERFESCGAFVEALGGAGGRRNARGKTLMGWVAALALLGGAGAWWGVKQAVVGETAGEPPAPPEEARLEAASPEEAERVRAEREEQIRQESEELEETVYRLAPLARTRAENAEGMGYDRGQRFGEKLDEMREKLQQGEAAMAGRNFGKAKAWFEESMAAAGWCEENAPLRAAAGRAKGAAEEAKKKAEAMDGAHLGLTAWRKGEKAREAAETAWGEAAFRDATAGWNEAGTAYAESEKAARAAKVDQGLEAVRGAMKRGAWEAVIAAADGVLELDGDNAEAKRLKKEAEGQLKPSIRLKATLNGREVAATVTEGLAQSGRTTPVTVNLERGGGSYGFSVEYEAAGKKYEGRTTVQARERGGTDAIIALQERTDPEPGEERDFDLGNGTTIRMVWCPAGEFTMGSPNWEKGRDNDETQHRVTLTKGFWLAKHEVTQKQWKSVMETNPSHFKGDDLPVENVSWTDCQAFCRKTGLRLPTEAEWEYACRAGSTGPYAGTGRLEDMGWYTFHSGSQTHPVGLKQPNAWGLHDMHGNVWEWCADRYQKDLGSEAVTDPSGPESGAYRVRRGGSWNSLAGICRSAFRVYLSPDDRNYSIGFRLARNGP